VRAIDSVRSGDEIELSQRNFYLNSIGARGPPLPTGRILLRKRNECRSGLDIAQRMRANAHARHRRFRIDVYQSLRRRVAGFENIRLIIPARENRT
ncbi:hypothetical protein, partial [Burkholderia ubonensis]|uniref:hypothetical protein n=1 Tax=Burkholderia ubonensis TaxID=101571 RepID=UPI001E4A9867